jgi:hypothetical protein
MNAVPDLRLRSVEEDVDPRDVTIDEPSVFENSTCAGEVFSTEQHVHVSRRPGERFVDPRHPRRDRVAADDRVRNAAGLECRRDAMQPLLNPFERVHDSLVRERQ